MQRLVCQFVLLSLLFLSLDSAADRVSEGHPHAGMNDAGATLLLCLSQTEDDEEHHDIDENHCEHCCHGHTASIATEVRKQVSANHAEPVLCRLAHLHARDRSAPPTPPPNA